MGSRPISSSPPSLFLGGFSPSKNGSVALLYSITIMDIFPRPSPLFPLPRKGDNLTLRSTIFFPPLAKLRTHSFPLWILLSRRALPNIIFSSYFFFFSLCGTRRRVLNPLPFFGTVDTAYLFSSRSFRSSGLVDLSHHCRSGV